MLVGYFILGPSDLYKIVKEVGKFIQNARTLSSDLSKTFENNMESQLQLEEIRKAQRELNDAFSFRRSINVDTDEEAFTTNVETPRQTSVQDAAYAVAEKPQTRKKKKIRRRKKPTDEENLSGEVPDLQMPSSVTQSSSYTNEERETIDREFDQYLSSPAQPDWYSNESNPVSSNTEKSRFQQQISGNWNEQVISNEDKLSPLAKVMEMLAVLEEERIATNKRLEEEFKLRKENEEKYYQKQRELLEQAASQVQREAYVGMKADD